MARVTGRAFLSSPKVWVAFRSGWFISHTGARRRFSQDLSHPEIVYEPGKCINCDICVRIAAAEGEALGLSMIGRGFNVAIAVPFGRPLAEGLRKSARRCAEACPSGALALRTARCAYKRESATESLWGDSMH